MFIHDGVPTFFRACCAEVKSRCREGGYAHPGYTLMGSVEREIPFDASTEDWLSEVALLYEMFASEDLSAALIWFVDRFPKCMTLVPKRRREKFIEGAYQRFLVDRRGFDRKGAKEKAAIAIEAFARKKGFVKMDLKQTAIHEAGHVVVAYVLGLACDEVALTHDEVKETGAYGFVTSPNPTYGYEVESPKERQKILRDQSISCCAGLAAEHVLLGVPLSTDNENSQSDFQHIIQFEHDGLKIKGKRNGFVGDDATWRFISSLLEEAKELVIQHRDAIQRLADILIECKQLSEEEVTRLLEEWIPGCLSS